MSKERRIRDEDGCSIYYNIDEPSDCVTGAGVFNIMKNVTTKVASKLTGKAAKKIAEKAIEKGAEKVGEKTGEKLGVLLGEKIYDRFRGERKELAQGDQIIKELQKGKKPPPGEKSLTQQYDELLKNNQELSTKSISQQFDELLKL